jgi:hypothetical protein
MANVELNQLGYKFQERQVFLHFLPLSHLFWLNHSKTATASISTKASFGSFEISMAALAG